MTHNADAKVLKDIRCILNFDNIAHDVDIKELERQIIYGGSTRAPPDDMQAKYNAELERAARDLGIEFEPVSSAATSTGASASVGAGAGATDDIFAQTADAQTESDSEEDEPYARDGGASTGGASTGASAYSASGGASASAGASAHRQSQFIPDTLPFSAHGELGQRTQEQQRRAHIENVIGEDAGDNWFDAERKEDAKCEMLAEIDQLKKSLQDMDVDLSLITMPDEHSSYEQIHKVLRTLRYKNDHMQYCTFAEELLLGGAYFMEDLFNGQRTWFGKYKPDLTGWHNHVNVKLRRMRHDTSQVVRGAMQDYNVGPIARICMELVPSMFLYSRTRKQHHGQKDLFTDDEMNRAKEQIRTLS